MSEYGEQRREERRQELAMSLNDGDGVDAVGQVYQYGDPDESEYEPDWQAEDDPDEYEQGEEEYEYEDDAEPDEWVDPAAEVERLSQETQSLFESHVSELEQETGITLTQRERDEMRMNSLALGGFTAERTSTIFYSTAYRQREAAIEAGEAAAQEHLARRQSKDPNERRRARREAMVSEIENNGNGWFGR